MQDIWTEELSPVAVRTPDGPDQLVAAVTVTGIGRRAMHAHIELAGELCAGTTPAVAEVVDRVLALGVLDLRFDLHPLRLCTSAGIDMWVDTAARVLPQGGDVRLAGASGVVRRALDAVGVSDSAEFHPPFLN
ncbi:MAG TPA: STAS domain-containing protein [Acidimicrobiales bacterium]|nr:STAS domain-containing protein [Acidimicrobiales bacterium]